jgi:hypothetical protein
MKETRNIFGCLAVALLAFALVAPARADIVQLWNFDTTASSVELFTEGTQFDLPGVTGLTAGWTLNQPNPEYAVMTGPLAPAGTLYTMNIVDPGTDFAVDILEYNGAGLNEQVRFHYLLSNPGGYANNYGNWYWGQTGSVDPALAETVYDRAPTTPEPATTGMIGGSACLLGIGLAFWRQRRRAAKQ